MTLIEAMWKAGSADPGKYLSELAKTSRQGVTGPIAFDEKGDLKNGPITVYVVKDGKWDPLETMGGSAAVAAAPAPPPAAGAAPAPAAEKPAVEKK
jgi:branched-chain amino acid transport system substrate-binding protein